MAVVVGSTPAWNNAMAQLGNLLSTSGSDAGRTFVQETTLIAREDVRKDAKVYDSILQNTLFKNTLERLFGAGLPNIDLGDLLEKVLANPAYGDPRNIFYVYWLQPFSLKNALKKGRAPYLGDLPTTNRLPGSIMNFFVDAGADIAEITGTGKVTPASTINPLTGFVEWVTPGSYVDPATRRSLGNPNQPRVDLWTGPDGTDELPEGIFKLLGLNYGLDFKITSFKGEKVIAASGRPNGEIRITLKYTYNGVAKTAIFIRETSGSGTYTVDIGGGVNPDVNPGSNFFAGNQTKNTWFTNQAANAPSTEESILWLIMKELGDTLQVIYAKLFMGDLATNANMAGGGIQSGGAGADSVCVCSPDRTVLIRCKQFQVPCLYRQVVDPKEKSYENLGTSIYYHCDFDLLASCISKITSYYEQATQQNLKMKVLLLRFLASGNASGKIDVGGVNMTIGNGAAGTIRHFFTEEIIPALDAANTWLTGQKDAAVTAATAASAVIVPAAPGADVTAATEELRYNIHYRMKIQAASVTAVVLLDGAGGKNGIAEGGYTTKATRLFIDPPEGIVDPIRATGINLHTILIRKSQIGAGSARSARVNNRGVVPATVTAVTVGGYNYGDDDDDTLNAWDNYTPTELFASYVLILLRSILDSTAFSTRLMKQAYYTAVAVDANLYTQYLEDLADDICRILDPFLFRMSGVPTNINILLQLITWYFNGYLDTCSLTDFYSQYMAAEGLEEIRLKTYYASVNAALEDNTALPARAITAPNESPFFAPCVAAVNTYRIRMDTVYGGLLFYDSNLMFLTEIFAQEEASPKATSAAQAVILAEQKKALVRSQVTAAATAGVPLPNSIQENVTRAETILDKIVRGYDVAWSIPTAKELKEQAFIVAVIDLNLAIGGYDTMLFSGTSSALNFLSIIAETSSDIKIKNAADELFESLKNSTATLEAITAAKQIGKSIETQLLKSSITSKSLTSAVAEILQETTAANEKKKREELRIAKLGLEPNAARNLERTAERKAANLKSFDTPTTGIRGSFAKSMAKSKAFKAAQTLKRRQGLVLGGAYKKRTRKAKHRNFNRTRRIRRQDRRRRTRRNN